MSSIIFTVLNLIGKDDSTNAKLAILKTYEDNDLLKRVYKMAYHPRLQYGIKKIPHYDQVDSSGTLEDALDYLEFTLSPRKLTGRAAISKLVEILERLSSDDAEVLKLIIKRDLNCGASSTLANKVWKNLIPKQPQMLASSMSEQAIANITFPAMAQLKADGARCFAEIRGDTLDDVKLLSRAGNEYLNLDMVKSELISMTAAYRGVHGPCMVDGELVYFASKATGNQAVGIEWMMNNEEVTGTAIVTSDKETKPVVALRSESNGIANKSLKGTITKQESSAMSFQVWDVVPLKVIYDNEQSLTYSKRFEQLTEMANKSKRIIVIENELVEDIDEAKAIYKSYVSQGLEGIILKNTFGLWENKRSKNQVKFKEEITVDLRIVDIQEHSKDMGKLGAVHLASDDNLIKVRCGSGFTDTNTRKDGKILVNIPMSERDELNREKLWLNADELIGSIVEIKCNGYITAAGRKDSVSLFLPVITSIRYDKTDTNALADIFPAALNELEV